ncbi:MAG: hypothetical protein ABH824_07100 [Nanoarchaeota archaeon]
MDYLNKIAKLAPETLVKMLLLSAVLIIIIGILIAWKADFNEEKIDSLMCYVSNGLKSETWSTIFPTTCVYKPLQDPLEMSELSEILTALWFSHGQGDWSFGEGIDESLLRYSFYLKNETTISDLFKYLLTHRGRFKTDVISDSDYNYLQKGSEGETLCFGEEILVGDGAKLFTNQHYFIFFVDDQEFFGKALKDKIVITKTSSSGKKSSFKCVSPQGDITDQGTLSLGVTFEDMGKFDGVNADV